MDIIGHKTIFLTVSGILVLASFAVLGIFGLNLGIDFIGGSLLEVEFIKERPSFDAVREAIGETQFANAVIQPTGDTGLLLRFQDVNEAGHQELLGVLAEVSQGELVELRFDSIGPVIGQELKRRSLIALGLTIAQNLFLLGNMALLQSWR